MRHKIWISSFERIEDLSLNVFKIYGIFKIVNDVITYDIYGEDNKICTLNVDLSSLFYDKVVSYLLQYSSVEDRSIIFKELDNSILGQLEFCSNVDLSVNKEYCNISSLKYLVSYYEFDVYKYNHSNSGSLFRTTIPTYFVTSESDDF